jgi:defect-in-organelle-trafficking protein DotB
VSIETGVEMEMGQACALPVLQWLTGYKDPFRFKDQKELSALMLEIRAHRCSDIFIQPTLPIVVRVSGRMRCITHRTIDAGEVKQLVNWLVGRDTAFTDIIGRRAVNGRYELFDPTARESTGARVRYGYRVNATPILGEGETSAQVVIREIPGDPPTVAEVGLTQEVLDGCTPENGIVYIAGSTGSGKTTSIAAILRYILENDTPIQGNLVTGEEPIEFRFNTIRSTHSIIVQTQIPSMLESFHDFNRECMRRAPKLILYGELRDQETISAAIEASLTGHPVFGTVHATDVASIMRRLISRFPESQRSTAIFDIVDTARFMLAQRLVRGVDGKLLAVREYLRFDEEVREELSALSDMGKVGQLVKRLVDCHGHSFKAEARALFDAQRIDEHAARQIAKGDF